MKKSIKRATMKVTAAAVITSSVLAGTPGIMSMAADNANRHEDKSEVKGKPATVEEAKQNLQEANVYLLVQTFSAALHSLFHP